MDINRFFEHHGIQENPFSAEEARHDPVFERLTEATPADHPDFAKLMGQPDKPSSAVAFGEKGSGKTAIRISMERTIHRHNHDHPDRRVLVVPYDDLNPFLDNFLSRHRSTPDEALRRIRLADHQDAILSVAVTRVVDAVLGETRDAGARMLLPGKKPRPRKHLSRPARVDLTILAALYDQPEQGPIRSRWRRFRSKVGAGWGLGLRSLPWAGLLLLVAAGAGALWVWTEADAPAWAEWGAWAALGLGVAALGAWGWRQFKAWRLARAIRRETPMLNADARDLRKLLAEISPRELDHRPLPVAEGASDTRYQLTRRLLLALSALGHVGMTVVFDRVDEPTVISGDARRMRSVVWPLLDNKFLDQEGVGIKLLLPLDLHYLLHRESGEFFQEARLDKQNVVAPLTWSGAILYDLCTRRMNACRAPDRDPLTLTDLFEEDVDQEHLMNALHQMAQPRDALKFLYMVIQEHCRLVPDAAERFRISRVTVDSVREHESQRVKELSRGVAPA